MATLRAYGRPQSPIPPRVNWGGLAQVGLVLLVAAVAWQAHFVYQRRQKQWGEVESWINKHGLQDIRESIIQSGLKTMEDIAAVHLPLHESLYFKLLPQESLIRLLGAIQILKDEKLLFQWLVDHSLEEYFNRMLAEQITSLDNLAHISENKLQHIVGLEATVTDYKTFQQKLQKLHLLSPNFSQYKPKGNTLFTLSTLVNIIACLLFLAFVYFYCSLRSAFAQFQSQSRRRSSLLTYVTGDYLDPQYSVVDWEWTDHHVVGHTFHFRVKFYKRNRAPYPIASSDNLAVEICQSGMVLNPTVKHGNLDELDEYNVAKVTFTVHKAGAYKISVRIAGKHINGSPFEWNFIAGQMDPKKSSFVNQGSVVVGCQSTTQIFRIDARDIYENVCAYATVQNLLDKFKVDVTDTENLASVVPDCNMSYDKHDKKILMELTFEQLGCYHVLVTYDENKLKNSDFHILLLTEQELWTVDRALIKRNRTASFEARLLSTHYNTPTDKGKKVFCYISPKQLTIKEFQLKIIPKKLFTFRVCPSTKFQFLGSHNKLGTPVLSIEDSCQTPILLASNDRNIIAATFSKHLMKNIGGSESFKDKQEFFYNEIRQLHNKRVHDRIPVKINRSRLLECSYRATRGFSTTDWCKKFEIIFHQEEGVDWGGVSREWFEMLCTELFDPTKSQLFVRFKEDDPQALVHPNHLRPPYLKTKYYEFAGKIVGKCLYESSLGGSYKQQVKAKFSRSFLAQLIGLRVNYKYFEKDDPDLYTTKVRYIEENDVDDMELTFTEEEFNQQGQLEKVVELIPGGAKIAVTNVNKMKYLDALAQYKLASKVQDEIEAFLKGLNDLVPDNLLSIFDENELELLMCGTGNYSISDFMKNHTVSATSAEFAKIIEWFWVIVSGFTQEDMARLLQFTTGCSQLPPGGFSKLTPNFQISAIPMYKVLPTAHTCFNQLCLPDYDTLEEMQRAIRLAITEGNQGFGMI